MMHNSNLESNVISFLRFPLIVAVVFIHSNPGSIIIDGINIYSHDSYYIYENLRYFISEIISRVSVPLFFFISGFLFFKKVDVFSKEIYLDKVRKRIRTLLIPYIFWNLIVVLLFYLSQTFLSGLVSGNNLLIKDYTIINWLKAFWNGNSGNNMPINNPLWFLRDLMVTVILSPVIYWFIRNYKLYVLSLLGILWLLDFWFSVPGISIVAIFFFSYGAYFSICKKNLISIFSQYFPISVFGYIFLSICNLVLRNNSWCLYIHNLGILFGITAFISLTAYCLNRNIWHVNSQLSNSSFFIYVYHGMPLLLISKCLSKIIHPQSDVTFIFIYIFSPCIIILLGYLLYRLLIKYFPRFASIVVGGR